MALVKSFSKDEVNRLANDTAEKLKSILNEKGQINDKGELSDEIKESVKDLIDLIKDIPEDKLKQFSKRHCLQNDTENEEDDNSIYKNLWNFEQFQFLKGYCDCYYTLAYNLYVYDKIKKIIDSFHVKRKAYGKNRNHRIVKNTKNPDTEELFQTFRINKKMEKHMKIVQKNIKNRNEEKLLNFLGNLNSAIIKQTIKLGFDKKLQEKGIYGNIYDLDILRDLMSDIDSDCPEE